MSRSQTFMCDGPSCLEMVENAEDEDDLLEDGWMVVTFTSPDEDERNAHLHSYACLMEWAAEAVEDGG